MNPPIIRPSSLPALAKCPCYSADQSENVDAKTAGTRRHDALDKLMRGDADWANNLGEWDADGVQWAAEYIRTHAPMQDYPVTIEQPSVAILDDFTELRGTPDVVCGHHLFDLKGRNVDSYREQMAAYVLMTGWSGVHVHVLYCTERRATTYTLARAEASRIVEQVVNAATATDRAPRVCDWCAWCSNRAACPALDSVAKQAAGNLGLNVPTAPIDEITDAAGLRELKLAADAVSEWAKAASAHVRTMAVERGVIADGFRIVSRKGNPSITDAWAAIQAAGLPVEKVAASLSISLPALAKAYAEHNQQSEKAARTDLESRLGTLVQRGASVYYLSPVN